MRVENEVGHIRHADHGQARQSLVLKELPEGRAFPGKLIDNNGGFRLIPNHVQDVLDDTRCC